MNRPPPHDPDDPANCDCWGCCNRRRVEQAKLRWAEEQERARTSTRGLILRYTGEVPNPKGPISMYVLEGGQERAAGSMKEILATDLGCIFQFLGMGQRHDAITKARQTGEAHLDEMWKIWDREEQKQAKDGSPWIPSRW